MGLRAWSVASAPDRLRSKPLQPPPDVEGAVAPYLVQDRSPWTPGTPSGVGGSFSATFQTFPEHMVARKRDSRCSPRGGTRFCASAVEHGKKTGSPLAVFHGGGHRGKQWKTSIFSVFPKDARRRWFAIGRGDRNVLRERERGGGGKRLFDLGTTARAPSPRRGGRRERGGLSSRFPSAWSRGSATEGGSTGRDTLLHVRSGNSWRDNGARSCSLGILPRNRAGHRNGGRARWRTVIRSGFPGPGNKENERERKRNRNRLKCPNQAFCMEATYAES